VTPGDVLWRSLQMRLKMWTLAGIALTCWTIGMLVAAVVYFALPAHYVSQRVLTVTLAGGSLAGRGTSGWLGRRGHDQLA
jgi:hypothetical protein